MKQTRNKHSPAFTVAKRPSPSWPADLRSIPVRFTPGKGPWWKEPRSYLPPISQEKAKEAQINHLYRHRLKVERRRSMSRSIRRAMIDRDHQQLSLVRSILLDVSRASVYYRPVPRAEDLEYGPDGPSVFEDPLLRLQPGCCNRAIW